MHWRTYRRLRDQAHAAKAEADDLLAESMLGQFLNPVPPRRKRQRGRRDGAPKPPPAAALHQLHLGRTGPIGPERRQYDLLNPRRGIMMRLMQINGADAGTPAVQFQLSTLGLAQTIRTDGATEWKYAVATGSEP